MRRFGPDAWKSGWPPTYNFIVRNEGETAKSGWALNLVAPRRWGSIYQLALFRQHKTAQGHGFVLCFLSDLWPEFTPWIQKGSMDMYRSIDFMSKAWCLLSCDWIIATFMLGLASVLNRVESTTDCKRVCLPAANSSVVLVDWGEKRVADSKQMNESRFFAPTFVFSDS